MGEIKASLWHGALLTLSCLSFFFSRNWEEKKMIKFTVVLTITRNMWSPKTHQWETPLQEWSGRLGWAWETTENFRHCPQRHFSGAEMLLFLPTCSYLMSPVSGSGQAPRGPSPLQWYSWTEPSPTLSEKDPSVLQSTWGPRCGGTTSQTSVRTTKKRGSAALEVSRSCLQVGMYCTWSAEVSNPDGDPKFVALRCTVINSQAPVCRVRISSPEVM